MMLMCQISCLRMLNLFLSDMPNKVSDNQERAFHKKAGDGLALNFGPGLLPLNADSF